MAIFIAINYQRILVAKLCH